MEIKRRRKMANKTSVNIGDCRRPVGNDGSVGPEKSYGPRCLRLLAERVRHPQKRGRSRPSVECESAGRRRHTLCQEYDTTAEGQAFLPGDQHSARLAGISRP